MGSVIAGAFGGADDGKVSLAKAAGFEDTLADWTATVLARVLRRGCHAVGDIGCKGNDIVLCDGEQMCAVDGGRTAGPSPRSARAPCGPA